MRVLALAAYPMRCASTRFRMGQYLAGLRQAGLDVRFAAMLDDTTFARLYRPGFAAKALGVAAGSALQLARVAAEARRAQVIWVQREASLVGPEWLEVLAMAAADARLVLDLDDAVWLEPEHSANAGMRWLRRPAKTPRLMARAQTVVAGNRYLAEFAARYCRDVRVIPTVVPREPYVPRAEVAAVPVVGWVGSHSTAPYLRALAPQLAALAERGLRFVFRTVGAPDDSELRLLLGPVEWQRRPWSLEAEAAEVAAFDIGVAPMPPGPWTDGKCGFKLVQYMAAGVPYVTSPWAGQDDVVREGEDGLVARAPGDWSVQLERLIEDATLRQRLGAAGRRAVEDRLCVEAQLPALVAALRGR